MPSDTIHVFVVSFAFVGLSYRSLPDLVLHDNKPSIISSTNASTNLQMFQIYNDGTLPRIPYTVATQQLRYKKDSAVRFKKQRKLISKKQGQQFTRSYNPSQSQNNKPLNQDV
jgi:hypothetical protein